MPEVFTKNCKLNIIEYGQYAVPTERSMKMFWSEFVSCLRTFLKA